MIRAIVTDIEGTTSSISFVHEVLFPYARARMADFVRDHGTDPEVRPLLAQVAAEQSDAQDDEAVVAVLIRWMDEDRKATPLKALQGMIWAAGYADGDFSGHVYPDAAEHLKRWHQGGIQLYVYSSGSVPAQKQLFGHTPWGDINPLFSGYFDTRTGNKMEPESYTIIAREISCDPAQVLFLSDIGGELDAARSAGMHTCQLVRKGTVPVESHPQAKDFAAVSLPE
jgi:enolase-phosphatase E1